MWRVLAMYTYRKQAENWSLFAELSFGPKNKPQLQMPSREGNGLRLYSFSPVFWWYFDSVLDFDDDTLRYAIRAREEDIHGGEESQKGDPDVG
jgi:hypothetical protein